MSPNHKNLKQSHDLFSLFSVSILAVLFHAYYVRASEDSDAVLCSCCTEKLPPSNDIGTMEKGEMISFLMSKVGQES